MNGSPRSGRVFLAVFLLLVLRSALSLGSRQQNELDVLAHARQAADPDWLPQDRYLAQPTSHRKVFEAIFGPLLRVMPFETVAVLGRCVSFALFAMAFQALATLLKLRRLWSMAALLVFLPLQTVVAGEWMVDGLESKTFAYSFCLLALPALLRRRYASGFFLLGLSVTSHVLVGLYGTMCAAVLLLAHRRAAEPRHTAWAFLAGAAPGIWAFATDLPGAGGSLDPEAAWIYVHFRNPHHLSPAFWLEHRQGVICLAAVLLLTAALGAVAVRHPEERRRMLASFALASAGLFAFGLAAAALGWDWLLQLYWFRFGSVVLPLVALLLLADRGGSVWTGSWATAALRLFVVLGCLWNVVSGLGGWNGGIYTQGLEPERIEVQRWIRLHAPRQAVFLLDPFWPEFYVLAERARFVSFKHVPHTSAGIVEWFEGLVQLNGGSPPRRSGSASREEIVQNFRSLSRPQVLGLARRHGLTHALVDAAADPLAGAGPEVIEIHRNARYVVYELRAAAARSGSSG